MYLSLALRLCLNNDKILSILNKNCKRNKILSLIYGLINVIDFKIINFYSKNTSIIVLSNHYRNLIKSKFKNRIEVFPNFICGEIKKIEIKKRNKIIFVGRNNGSKGFEKFIELAKKFRHEKFIVVGNFTNDVALNNVEYLGWKSKNEIFELFLDSKLGIFFNEAPETFGIAPLEAITHGTPVLLSSIYSFKEYYSKIPFCKVLDDLSVLSIIKELDSFLKLYDKKYHEIHSSILKSSLNKNFKLTVKSKLNV